MNKRRLTIAMVLLVLCLAAFLAYETNNRAETNNPQENLADTIRQRAHRNLGEATPVQEGVVTERQRRHGRIYRGYGGPRRRLRDLIASQGDVEARREIGFLPNLSLSRQDALSYLSCKADVIVVGTVRSKSSQLIEDGTFVFTDYELTVEDILKNNSASPIEQRGDITVTRSGGAIRLNGHIVRAIDYNNEPLGVGERYLLYLLYVPDTGVYRALSSDLANDTFHLQSDRVVQASQRSRPLGRQENVDVNNFMIDVRAVLTGNCDRWRNVQ